MRLITFGMINNFDGAGPGLLMLR